VNNGKEQCSTHAIPFETLKAVVLADIKQYAKLAEKDEDILINRVMDSSAKDRDRERGAQQSKLRDIQKRVAAIDQAIKQLFEEKLAGNVPNGIFKKLMEDYEAEQTRLTDEIADVEKKLARKASEKSEAEKWIGLIKDCINLRELDRATAVALINRIDVSEQFVADGQRQQNIAIKYNFIGSVLETRTEKLVSA
jgi:uncharacterized protein YeeX (DUF496 family)